MTSTVNNLRPGVVRGFVNSRARPLVLVAFVVGMVAAGCGGSEAVDTVALAADNTPAGSEYSASVEAVAAANLELLRMADDARDVEVLDVGDGSIATLRNAVDGDRPVLVWFWAPH